jgi:hypothetical protein
MRRAAPARRIDPLTQPRKGTALSRRAIGARLAAFLVMIVAVSACSGPQGATGAPPTPVTASPTEPTPVGTVRVSKFGCPLEGVAGPIGAGEVVVAVVNETDLRVDVVMVGIPESHRYEELAANIEEAVKSARKGGPVVPHLEWLLFPDGLTISLFPGESGSMTGSVDPGTYGIVCLRTYPQVGDLRPNGVFGPLTVG